MGFQKFFTILSGILFLIGFVPYALAIIRNQTQPAKASWIIWAVMDSITFFGMIAEKSLNGQMIGVIIGVWFIVGLAIWKGSGGWTRIDKFSLAGSAMSLALWAIFQNALLGLICISAVGFIGSFPTFASAWKDPSKENKLAWIIFWVSCVSATIAIPKWDIANALQPLTFLSIETIMMYILFIRPRQQ